MDGEAEAAKPKFNFWLFFFSFLLFGPFVDRILSWVYSQMSPSVRNGVAAAIAVLLAVALALAIRSTWRIWRS